MNNNSFTISPMGQRFTLEPGKSVTGKITIINPADSTEDFAYKIGISPYGVTDGDYTADLTTDYARSAITKWIKISEPVGTVAPNESKDVEFTITVPADAPVGGQYAAITVTSNATKPAQSGVAVQNIFEMASIIYGNVSGQARHEGEVLENNVPGFSAVTPVTLTASVSNNGNVHEDASVLIKVSNFFTGEVILPTEDDDGLYNEIIMPETTKYIERNVSNLPAIGVVKISQTIYYNGNVSIVEKDVIICPIWFMALVLATLISIVTTIILTIKKHKKKKNRV